MLLTIGIIAMAILCVGCAVFLGLAPEERAVERRRDAEREASRFFLAGSEPRVGREAALDLLLKDLEAHIRAETQVAEGFWSRPDPESLRRGASAGEWVN